MWQPRMIRNMNYMILDSKYTVGPIGVMDGWPIFFKILSLMELPYMKIQLNASIKYIILTNSSEIPNELTHEFML